MTADDLDIVFRALGNASRRLLLDRLREDNGLTLGGLCEGLSMSRQAVTQHLAVLEQAKLVTTIWHGREKLHYLNPVPLQAVADRWIGKFERSRLRLLGDLKEKLEGDTMGKKPSFVYVIYINASAEAVWNGLIDPEFTRIYWQHENVSDWEPGSRWEHRNLGGGTDIVGEVLESDRARRLVLSWVQPADEGNAEKTSRVTFQLEPEEWPGGPWIRLTVMHTELEAEVRDSVSYGWPAVMSVLKTLLELRKGEEAAA